MRSHPCLRAIAFVVAMCSAAAADFCPDAGTVYPTGDSPFSIQVCDLNGDGRPDLVTANADTDTVSVLLRNADGTYAAPVIFATGDEPGDLACCDVDGDTNLDIVTVNHITDDVRIHFNNGSGEFTAPGVSYAVGEAPWGVRCLHLNGDAHLDLVTANYTGDSVSVLLNNGDGTFAPHASGRDYATDNGTFSVATCDVDGDADLDVVSSNLLSSNVSVFRNNGDGTLVKIESFSVLSAVDNFRQVFPWGMACCDLDGVNGNDVLTAGSAPLSVLFNNGDGTLGNLVRYTTGLTNPYKLDCADLDADGDNDVVVSDLGSDDLRVFLNAGNGTLGAPSVLVVGANPCNVVCRDTDSDTDIDVVTCSSAGARVFENDCDGGTCGDGVLDPDEACDDGFTDACGACNATCTGPGSGSICGDGVLCPESEACDDGNTVDTDDCTNNCTVSGCQPPTVSVLGPRYLGVKPATGPATVALKVTGVETDVACVTGWVQADGTVSTTPVFRSPATWGTVSVRGAGLVSNRTFQVQSDCDSGNPGMAFSNPVSSTLWKWGDTNTDNVVDVIDIIRVIDGFQGLFDSNTPCTTDAQCTSVGPNFKCNVSSGFCTRIRKENVDLIGNASAECLPTFVVDVLDLVLVLNAFAGSPGPCLPPCP